MDPISATLDREEAMYELYDMVRCGDIRLEEAFLKLGLGFAPAVNEKALVFAVTSTMAFTDLFNACVDEQASQLDTMPKQRSANQELNPRGAAHITVFSGAEPDDIDHEHFKNASDNQNAALISPNRTPPSKASPQTVEGLSIEPIKEKRVRRERRLSVDGDRLKPHLCELTATAFDEHSGATTTAGRKERRRSTDGSIMAGVRRRARQNIWRISLKPWDPRRLLPEAP